MVDDRRDPAGCASNAAKPKTKSKRVERIEWDHIVPAESFGQAFKEWRDGQTRAPPDYNYTRP